VGILGEVHPGLAKEFDLVRRTFILELRWPLLMEKAQLKARYHPYSLVPSVERDLSLLVDKEVHAADLIKAIHESGRPLVSQVSVFDLYEGKNLPAGKRSLGLSLRLGGEGHTLTDGQVTDIYDKITQSLKRGFNAEIR